MGMNLPAMQSGSDDPMKALPPVKAVGVGVVDWSIPVLISRVANPSGARMGSVLRFRPAVLGEGDG
jgi:hypothetical protein